jgi:hypothetical protein
MATLFHEIAIIERSAIADAERVGGERGLSTGSVSSDGSGAINTDAGFRTPPWPDRAWHGAWPGT